MRKIKILIFSFFLFLLSAIPVSADTNVGGTISQNTTWSVSNSPYIVTANVVIDAGVTLTIEPGVLVKFDSGKAILVNGGFVAKGTEEDTILFTSNQQSPAPGNWAGITFSGTSDPATFDGNGNYLSGSVVQYATVEYAGSGGLDNAGLAIDRTYIDHTIIRNNAGYGLLGGNGARITNNTLTGNRGGAMNPGGNGTIVSGNTITNNVLTVGDHRAAGITLRWTTNVTIENNIISNNIANCCSLTPGGILAFGSSPVINNNIITGNRGDAGAIEIHTDNGQGVQPIYTPIITNNTIYDNIGTNYAGGIHLGRDGFPANARIEDNNFTNNSGETISAPSPWSQITLKNNTIENNQGTGVNLDRIIGATITGNRIINNGGTGLTVRHQLDFNGTPVVPSIIRSNLFALNDRDGVSLDIGFSDFSCNTVVGNGTTSVDSGLLLINIPFISSFTGTISKNTFGDNSPYDVTAPSRAGATLPTGQNWWQTTNTNLIDAHIYDFLDDISKATMDYAPILTQADSCAPANIYTNTPPDINQIDDANVSVGDTYLINGSFSDTDSASWSATVDYGDGSGVQSLMLSGMNFSLSHIYITEGEYTLTVSVTDNQGATDTETAEISVVVSDPVTVTFTSSDDTHVRSGQGNHNYGGVPFMRIQSSGDNRGLVRFDQNAMQSSISGTVLSAELRLVITDNGNNWGTTGRTVDIHRLISDWAEGNGTESDRGTGSGATWNCAIDSLIENQAKNCSGSTEWEMGQPNNPSVHPWVETATDSETITNGQTGVVEYDVTADVQAFMNGTNNYGWLIRKTNEGQNGSVSFGSRESSSVPQLIVTYQP